MSEVEAEYTLYFNRLTSTDLTVTPTPTASIDPAALGATEARGYTVADRSIELVMLHFDDASLHDAAVDKLEALGWAEGHQFELAGAGPMLLFARCPESAGDQEDEIDALISAFAGEE